MKGLRKSELKKSDAGRLGRKSWGRMESGKEIWSKNKAVEEKEIWTSISWEEIRKTSGLSLDFLLLIVRIVGEVKKKIWTMDRQPG